MATKAILESRFPEIIVKLPLTVGAAVKIGATRVAEDARQRVPTATGRLRDAIHVETEDEGEVVYAGDHDVFYGHFVEYGTSNTPARPFLLPAFEAQRPGIALLVARALDRV